MQKKTTFLVSLLLLAAVVLSACGSSNANNQNGTPGANGTPGVLTTGTAAAGSGVGTATVAVGNGQATATTAAGAGQATATTAAGAPAANTTGTPVAATPGANVTGTPAANTTGTPNASVPVTGNQCRADFVSKLVGMTVRDTVGNDLGKVRGLIVLPGANANTTGSGNTANGNGNGNSKSNGNANGNGKAQGANSGNTNGNTLANGKGVQPVVDYVIMDWTYKGNTKTLAAPFQAFKLENKAAKNANSNNNASTSDCAVVTTLKGTQLGKAPAVDMNKLPDFTAQGWDKDYRTFWAGQGMIPATGAESAKMGRPVVIADGFKDMPAKNPNGDELGTVKDFIVNPANGQFQYAVLQAGGFLGIGSKWVPVPMNVTQWVTDQNNNNSLVINAPENAWKNAPSFDNEEAINTSASGWDQSIQTYWNGLGAQSK